MSRAVVDTPASDGSRRWLVLNPHSGGQEHATRVRRLAEKRGYRVFRTETAREGAALARRAAAADVGVLAVCGGDGTVHATVNGLHSADVLSAVTIGVLPAGTGNGFAASLGIDGIEQGFAAIETGTTREVRVYRAGSRLFLNGCTAGLNDDTETTGPPPRLKRLAGRFAYRFGGALRAVTTEGTPIEVRYTGPRGEGSWSGRALCVLVGRPAGVVGSVAPTDRRHEGFDVAIVERQALHRIAAGVAARRVLDREADAIITLAARRLDIAASDGDRAVFCFDGELSAHSRLGLAPHPTRLSVRSPT